MTGRFWVFTEVLIGSHAYGVLLNRLGVRATPYATEDIDIARREALAFERVPGKGLLEVLRESGIEFVKIPSLDKKKPATSFKQKGHARFQVDLLVPSSDETFPVVPVPELGANATGLPYLRYLLAESQVGALMAREGCCAVRVPIPERFAIHKLVVSRLRSGRAAKSAKDVQQAAILCAALADSHPGAIESAVLAIPKAASVLMFVFGPAMIRLPAPPQLLQSRPHAVLWPRTRRRFRGVSAQLRDGRLLGAFPGAVRQTVSKTCHVARAKNWRNEVVAWIAGPKGYRRAAGATELGGFSERGSNDDCRASEIPPAIFRAPPHCDDRDR